MSMDVGEPLVLREVAGVTDPHFVIPAQAGMTKREPLASSLVLSVSGFLPSQE